MPFDTAEEIVRGALSAVPDTRWEDSDPRNRIVIISMPEGQLNSVLEKLGLLFRIGPNADLKY